MSIRVVNWENSVAKICGVVTSIGSRILPEPAAASATHRPKSGRVLVICHKQLGDMTLLEPALARLAASFGGPVEVLTRSGHAPLIALMPTARMAERIWLRRFDAVFSYDDLTKSIFNAMLTFAPRKDLLLRSPTEITPLARRAFRSIAAPGVNEEYLGRYNWEHTLTESTEPFRPPHLEIPPDTWRPPDFALENYLLLNPTAGWKSKRWRASSWSRVLEALRPHGVDRVLITSGGQDWQIEHAQRIAEKLGDQAVFLGGQTRLEEFLWLVAHARMVLGVDGAASHLAAAFGGKNLTLFLRTNPHNWHLPTVRSRALIATHDAATDSYDFAIDDVVNEAAALWGLEP